ncbi:5-nucleotidase SurE [Anaerovibrio sp. JC8]|uniref:5'/3'-nucleotidase SurE n=1 Tax=Anaerovibrio sp. JC8 TaxID=1240085 RepID=UPI000A0A16A5|nr:5'/3'-nucleotidase SurE [Anaerovibrio sp. JC8]ORT99160.1 5-nucleotidase SurE [Anaerovibrio sp. JC8]
MKILITNDDGVQSKGIEALVKHLYKEHDVVVAAPASQQSAKAHAITVGQRIYIDEYETLKEAYGIEAYGIGGTPADSVKLYLEGILQNDEEKFPDLVISGINDGSNLGTDLIYSGTVGAAKEGFIHNIRSIAVSLSYNPVMTFGEAASELVRKLPELLSVEREEKEYLLNINFPVKLAKDYQWLWAYQGIRNYENAYIPRKDDDGRTYYIVEGNIIDEGNSPISDVVLCNQGNITVTPIRLKVADHKFLSDVAGKAL